MAFPGSATAGLLVLMTVLLWQRPPAAAPVPVHFPEGSLHRFPVLGTPEEVNIDSGDLLPVGLDGGVESRLEFHFLRMDRCSPKRWCSPGWRKS